jgi:hypothetical protein
VCSKCFLNIELDLGWSGRAGAGAFVCQPE